MTLHISKCKCKLFLVRSNGFARRLMNPKNAAGRLLCQFVYGTPKTLDEEVALMESYNQKVYLLFTNETNDGFDLYSFNHMTAKFDIVLMG